eukprot:8744555-Heterocapsa_arctica.AAC.1
MCPTAQGTNVRARAPYSQTKLSMGSWAARSTTTVHAQRSLRKLVPHRHLPSTFPENANGCHTPQPLRRAG